MSKIFKRTKILATIGPATYDPEMIYQVIDNGVNGCRLNFSHGEYSWHEQAIKWIREASQRRGKTVALVQDLQGPKIRLGEIDNNHYEVKAGDELILDFAVKAQNGNILPVQYNLAEKVKPGEAISIFDGKVQASVVEVVSKTAIKIKVKNDGAVASKKGINLPDTDFGGDVIPKKDREDVKWGAKQDFDYVAMSFIQSAADILQMRGILKELDYDAQIIAKIETKAAVESDKVMREIVKATDVIMVARGDMAIEIGAERVPVVQAKLVKMCRQYNKLCIVATQTMGSMTDNPIPTRAEASDVSTAVLQGADVVMLSEETAMGNYPLETVQTLRKIILYTQNHADMHDVEPEEPEQIYQVAKAAVGLAEDVKADSIVVETGSGLTARAVASRRPTLPILSVTGSQRVANQLALMYACSSFCRPFSVTYGPDLVRELKASGYFEDKPHKTVTISGKSPDGVGGCDSIQIRDL
ncbi:pyruvate kinase [Candidatus Saccharibacteria bacterium]|nr:pyruvate kinase [Candidatus Saccharibacteria bacterium]